jgi:aminodeoxyfutalosine synthase
MSAGSTFESQMDRVTAGERLTAAEIGELVTTPDILSLGMLADTLRRRLHDTRVTYLRVASCAFDEPLTERVLPVAREVRLTGTPESLAVAITAVRQAKAIAGERLVSGFSWSVVETLSRTDGTVSRVLEELRIAGLDALAQLSLDEMTNPTAAIEHVVAAGFTHLRVTVSKAAAAERVALFLLASQLQERLNCIQVINPLALSMNAVRPTTGYEDVKMVGVARLAAPNIECVQVDWMRYGPKLAQVALTFGADDLDGVTQSDDAPDGRRRAPLEEVRRNIEAAGFTPAERDGRFAVVSE